MNLSHPISQLTRRRGVVLVLVLALLSLLALIGVTFATLSGQAQVGARNYAAARASQLNPETLFDYALNQLINDSNNPKSALRGHSLLRDMYGHDARANGFLPDMPDPLGWPLAIWNVTFVDNANFTRTYQVETNVPTISNPLINQVPQLAQLFFGPQAGFPGWSMRLQQWVVNTNSQNGTYRNPGAPISQYVVPEVIVAGQNNDQASTVGRTFEVIGDDATGPWHILTLAPIPLWEIKQGRDNTTAGATDAPTPGLITPDVTLNGNPPRINRIQLDNRYVRAFNGTGMSQEGAASYIPPDRINFLFNNPMQPMGGFVDVNNFLAPAMDEDYDAADHENVFLGLQSADGQVVIPSFHRPNAMVYDPANPGYSGNPALYNDWINQVPNARNPVDNYKRAKVLRPRKADHPLSGDAFPDLTPDPNTGKITYDVDNDGDGVTDSVWLDLGYPAMPDSSGKLYKPLFAFSVIGLNGRIPLNSSGNLQARASQNLQLHGLTNPDATPVIDFYAGGRTFRHTSNLGYSSFEINPGFALTNSVAANAPMPDPPGVTRDGTWLLRRLLTGNDATGGFVPGRYGEPEAFQVGQMPAAGRSYQANPNLADLVDDNFNGTDFMPPHAYDYLTGLGTHPELANFYDGALRFQLPSERARYFVTPMDITGAGRIMEWDQLPNTSTAINYKPFLNFGRGYDQWGRVSYFQYFRPPGYPIDLIDDTNMNGDLRDEPLDDSLIATRFANVLHGFESHRNPATAAPNDRVNVPANNEFMARAPFNIPNLNPADPNLNERVPTFDNRINSSDVRSLLTYNAASNNGRGDPLVIRNGMYPGRNRVQDDINYPVNRDYVYHTTGGAGLALNDDTQLDLYTASPYDKLFDGKDLEWLLRHDDVDGSSLQSRLELLAQLVDVNGNNFQAFVNDDPLGITGDTRRRLFSTDSWDLNRYAWSLNAFSALNTPNQAHVGRKINLNLPLPTSHAYDEPTRVKWCRDTFDLLIQLFYPNYNFFTAPPTYTGTPPVPPAPPTPEAIARLGQFVVNIIDYRDTDDTMTRFINPYLKVLPSEFGDPDGNTVANEDHNGNGIIDPAGVTWINAIVAPMLDEPNYDGGANLYQWGMEYLPVAINEVLAYQFVRKNHNPLTQTGTKRFHLELANLLTEDANGDNATLRGGNASHLDLRGWGLVITADDPNFVPNPGETIAELPNTITGQVMADSLKNRFVPLRGTNAVPQGLLGRIEALQANAGGGAAALPNQTQAGGNHHYVFSNALSGLTSPNNTTGEADSGAITTPQSPQRDATLPVELEALLPLYPNFSTNRGYFWVHLVRPANPHAINMGPAEPRVVVDSMRFPYSEAGGAVMNPNTDTEQVTQGTTPLYLVERWQPYRGGEAVPNGHRFTPAYPYGWSQQTYANNDGDVNGNDQIGVFDRQRMGGFTVERITQPFHHSLGNQNDNTEDWDYFPFLDRDFASVAELLMVPDCPPGLFTKKFAENPGLPNPYLAGMFAPPLPAPPGVPTGNEISDGYAGSYPLAAPPPPPISFAGGSPDFAAGGILDNTPSRMARLHTYPYLNQRFNYWNSADPNDRAAAYMMLEFFEVPSPVIGAIGPVANGDNGDWLRRDLRPGAINANLIIDEEVFFGLLDDPRLVDLPAFAITSNLNAPTPPADPTWAATPGTGVPRVVTAVAPDGTPTISYPMSDLTAYPYGRGYFTPNPAVNWPVDVNGNPVPFNAMKAAFADFIKLRHGGSGYLGGVRAPITYPNALGNALPEKPFRSFTTLFPNQGNPANPYLSIYDTIMRPARLGAISGDVATRPAVQMNVKCAAMDPDDVRWFPRTEIPPRMLFQVPFQDDATYDYVNNVLTDPNGNDGSPAGEYQLADRTTLTYLGADHVNLTNRFAGLFDSSVDTDTTTTSALGWNGPTIPPNPPPPADRRRHPFWQTEMLQKVMNNMTVRTHQYAVWVTIGFFEVVQEGKGQDALLDPNLAVDQLGPEVGKAAGKSVRYKAFFIIDRTNAVGFDPNNPSDFRPLVTYRKRIE